MKSDNYFNNDIAEIACFGTYTTMKNIDEIICQIF